MLISHPAEKNVPEKLLIEHLKNVANISVNRLKQMRLNISEELILKEDLFSLMQIISLFHDFGKSTTYFQNYIKNPQTQNGSLMTRHSLLSAVVAYHIVLQKYKETDNKEIYSFIVYLVIKKHHGDLETLHGEDFNSIDILKRQLTDIKENNLTSLKTFYNSFDIDVFNIIETINLNDFMNESEEFEFFFEELKINNDLRIELFFIVNLLFSLLIDSDKKDAARLEMDYFDGNLNEPINDVFSYVDACRERDPDRFSSEIPINKIRNKFLEEIVNNKEIKKENHFYTISAPTGIGKTFGCLSFANKLKTLLPIDEGRIIYSLPYTSIIDQNFDEFEKIIKFNKKEKYDNRPSRYLLKHHHLSLKTIKNRVSVEEYSYNDYLDDKLFTESWESSMIVTTFVQFFHTIIGFKNRMLKKFHNIINSIVILDEVQNIDPEYYNLLKEVLSVLGKRFNIYFLLITATQPEIFKKDEVIELINSKLYMKHDLFNRVKLKYKKDLTTLDEFKNYFKENFSGENALIVMNTKKVAIFLANYFGENMKDYEIISLTTFLIPKDRRLRIENIKNKVKNKKKIIVVATQLIEAGVDISFKFVFRDFAPFDSIVQVAGRCNRNSEYGSLGGEMILLSLQDTYFVYKNILKQYVSEVLTDKCYESEDFYEISINYFNKFNFNSRSSKQLKSIYNLNYDTNIDDHIPVKDFKLIDDYSSENIYILMSKEAQKKMNELLEYKETIFKKKLNSIEIKEALLNIEKIKMYLKYYQISLKNYELQNYIDTNVIKEIGYIKYISYENQKKYAYDNNIGFLIEPKTNAGFKVF